MALNLIPNKTSTEFCAFDDSKAGKHRLHPWGELLPSRLEALTARRYLAGGRLTEINIEIAGYATVGAPELIEEIPDAKPRLLTCRGPKQGFIP